MFQDTQEQTMDTIELRIALTEEMVRELLWQVLVPEALVITQALNDAIAQQLDLRGISLEGYTLSGISVTVDAGVMHAELAYSPTQVAGDADL
jgi:hypothetical protein